MVDKSSDFEGLLWLYTLAEGLGRLTGARQRTNRKAEMVNITVRPTCRYRKQVSKSDHLFICRTHTGREHRVSMQGRDQGGIPGSDSSGKSRWLALRLGEAEGAIPQQFLEFQVLT